MDQATPPQTAIEIAEAIARTGASANAAGVDRDSRFPREAFAGIKSGRLLGMMIPADLGGGGASIAEVTAVCSVLSRACASTGLIFAMHQIQVASLLNAGLQSAWHRGFLTRIARDQLLLASATTEGGIGGDIRSSSCAVVANEGRITLEKLGTVISYGNEADAILVTARRNLEAPSSDQVMVAIEKAGYTLEQTATWDTLGMRGTSSFGHRLTAHGVTDQVLPKPFSDIATQSMLGTSHIFWSGVWHGIAADAFAKAQAFVRARARQNPGAPMPGAQRLAEASQKLQLLRSGIAEAGRLYSKALARDSWTEDASLAIALNNHKINSSELTVEIVHHALLICGIAGYRNDSPHSLGRNLRDAYSSQVMINNDRIETNVASLLMVSKHDGALFS